MQSIILRLIGYTNNAVGAYTNALKSIKKRDFVTARAHALDMATNTVSAIETFLALETLVTKDSDK